MNRKQNSLMKFSRNERLAQLSEQKIVIERKKREIQAKLEAQKKKETEEALKKLDPIKNNLEFLKKPSWKSDELKDLDKSDEPEKKEGLLNAFSNDGSFLDQFKKLSQTGLGPNVNIQTLAKKQENFDNRESNESLNSEKKEPDLKDEYRNQYWNDINSSSSIRTPLDSNIKVQLPPPGVVQLLPQHSMNSMVPSPSVQIPGIQPILSTLPQFTTNEIQLKAISSSPMYKETPQSVPPVQISNVQLSGNNSQFESYNQLPVVTNISSIQPPLPIVPQNIPPPSTIKVQNIPPPPLPSKDNELPNFRTESISMTLKSNSIKKLESIPNPLDTDQNLENDEAELGFSKKKDGTSKSLCLGSSSQKSNLCNEESSRVSSALPVNHEEGEEEGNQDLSEEICSLAKMVARCGDDFEESLRKRNENDPALRFLFDTNSKLYLSYRKLVLKHRRSLCNTYKEEGKADGDSCLVGDNKNEKFKPETSESRRKESPDSSNTIDTDSKKTECDFNTKSTDGYQADDSEEETPYYQMPTSESTSKDCFSLFPKQSSQNEIKRTNLDMSEEEDSKSSGERRKRKRKSRWGEVADPSIAPPSSVVLQPATQIGPPKSTLLSQLTRSDPGLIQYAKQTFGSTNLSEEMWKKAEDHYKINLLYQDLLKKRAELNKLEKAGKFKYEYDSDEDVEGGTWEHKLRQQEMMATQLWAEELTRQAAGKHHIGDFLPPEELERFMEKYNALKEGREPDLSDYKEFKLKEDNVGYRLLQKMGWNEGQGLGQDGTGITNPVNKASTRHENQGLGVERNVGLAAGDDEYDAYRKRMMLAYRFRPNPLNNPRRPYY